jgi:MFS superfamily sulfate permease-like transporter
MVYDTTTGLYKTKFRAIHDEEGPLEKIDNIIVIRLEEGMFFGNVGQLKDRLKRIEDHGDLGVHPSEEPAAINQSVFEDLTPQSLLLPRAPPGRTLRAIVFEMSSVSDIDARSE